MAAVVSASVAAAGTACATYERLTLHILATHSTRCYAQAIAALGALGAQCCHTVMRIRTFDGKCILALRTRGHGVVYASVARAAFSTC